MANSPQTYRLELCFKNPMILDAPLLDKILRRLGQGAEGLGLFQHRVLPEKKDHYSSGLLLMPELLEATEHGPAGLLLLFGLPKSADDDVAAAMSLEQTWQWNDAGTAIASASFRVSLAEVNTLHLGINSRLNLLHKGLYALAAALAPDALHFPQSQCLLEPAAYLENKPDTPTCFRPYGLMNTRLFTPQTPGAGNLLMDTLGLHLLGLPDLQCLIPVDSQDYAELTSWFCNLAEHLCEKPGELKDGDLVTGLRNKAWKLRAHQATIPPQREVLEIIIPSG
ncbi:MAG: DUF4261 domain-containing protein [Desulfovibrionaceae bacterium]|nr:DUF4261 domain-containing protein [Desulfovibrionaceae bacterium]